MEMKRRNPINVWLAVSLGIALLIIFVSLAMIPMFFRAREASHHSIQVEDRTNPMMSTQVYDKASPMPIKSAESAGSTEVSGWGTAYAATTQRMIISTADVSLEVKDVQKAHDEIAKIIRGTGGFLTQSIINKSDGQDTATITIRVPSKGYETVLVQVSKIGKILSKNEQGEDVTEEYVDLESRLRNLKREEEQFLKVLGRANRITDILAVERELARVRGEIEQATGRVKYLQSQVSLATINVSLSEPTPAVSKMVNWDVTRTVVSAANSLQALFRRLTSLTIWMIVFTPFWALIGAVVYGWKRYRRK